ncbi:nitrate reductase [Bacillus fungorum]|uniref:molybdopterin oxidoreductase family protein n=1 Tax=Bacillus fungorum TaxID=2039284 RepID=UPI0033919265
MSKPMQSCTVPSAVELYNLESGITSHCCFCSMQCAIELRSDAIQKKVTGAYPIKDFPVANGRVCLKGIVAHEHTQHKERLKTPLIRKKGKLTAATWDEALSTVVNRFKLIQSKYGKNSVSIFGGGSLTNEKAYLLGKFARVALQTSNIDYNGRYCMSSGAAAMNKVFGLDRGMTIPLDDIPLANCIIIVGANIAECQPTMMSYIRLAQKKGAKIVVIDPRNTLTARMADIHIPIKPGTDLALMNGILHVMIEDNLIDQHFIQQRTIGFNKVKEVIKEYTPQKVSQITGVSVENIVKVARWYGKATNAILYTARGVEQQARGVDNVLSCLNLVLASGKIGKIGCGYGAITGQANGQGGREHGQKADQLPGYRSIENIEHRKYIASIWGIEESELPKKGKTAYELFEAIMEEQIKGMFILASNPIASSPNKNYVQQAVKKLDTLVVVDIFLSETANMADIVLPGSSWTEDEGTMTNLEGRVLLRRAAQILPGEARLDWIILSSLAEKLGKGSYFPYQSAEDIFEELRLASAGGKADYSGITYDKLEKQKGIFWPCTNDNDLGTSRMFTEHFAHPHKKAIFHPVEYKIQSENGNCKHSYHLITGREINHYLTGVQTRKTSLLNKKSSTPYVEMHPYTAKIHNIQNGDWIEIGNDRGKARYQAKVIDSIRTDTLFVPIHWENEECVNLLTSSNLDPISKMPEFKNCRVSIKKL